MSNILEVKNLEIEKNKDQIIKDLSFTVEKGKIFTILGPNGAGKTTLLQALLNCIPYKGEIDWEVTNKDISYLPQSLSRKQFEKYPISIEDFFHLKIKKEEEIKEILDLVGLEKE